MRVLCVCELAQLAEPCEAPVAFLRHEPMMSVWVESIGASPDVIRSVRLRTADSVNRRVLGIRYDKGKLGTRMPAFGGFLGFCVIKINGDRVVWRSV